MDLVNETVIEVGRGDTVINSSRGKSEYINPICLLSTFSSVVNQSLKLT